MIAGRGDRAAQRGNPLALRLSRRHSHACRLRGHGGASGRGKRRSEGAARPGPGAVGAARATAATDRGAGSEARRAGGQGAARARHCPLAGPFRTAPGPQDGEGGRTPAPQRPAQSGRARAATSERGRASRPRRGSPGAARDGFLGGARLRRRSPLGGRRPQAQRRTPRGGGGRPARFRRRLPAAQRRRQRALSRRPHSRSPRRLRRRAADLREPAAQVSRRRRGSAGATRARALPARSRAQGRGEGGSQPADRGAPAGAGIGALAAAPAGIVRRAAMRTRTIARWSKAGWGGALALALAVPVRAQQDPPPPPVPPQAMDPQIQGQPSPRPAAKPKPPVQRPENAPITEQSPRPPPDGNIQPVPGTPEEYTIVKGDTLWDLSQKFLSNPWYWPKIWSLNPSIENPHWIYPGNKLRIVPGEGGAQAPAQVQAEEPGIDAEALNAPEETPPGASWETSVTTSDTPDLEVVKKNSRETRAALNSVSVSGKLAFSPPPVLSVRTSGLVTPEEMRDAGTLEASFEEKQMLSTYDTAYARFRHEVPAQVGDKLLLFRPEGPIVHPVSGRILA